MVNILIVDDSVLSCMMLTKLLQVEGTQVASVPDAEQAFEYVKQHTPDLILLDLVLPDMDGNRVCQMLKAMGQLKNVPIIFLTSTTDEKSVLRGFEAGATDYIFKPFSLAELRARVACHLQNKLMADQLRVANLRLLEMMEELSNQAYKDTLTNLYNRRYFLEGMERWKRRLSEPGNAHLFLMDVDHFKSINDTFGHCTGDYVLYTVADLILRSLDEFAVVGRWGGDEFLVLVLGVTAQQAMEMAERIRVLICEHPFAYDGNALHCTTTIGVAPLNPDLSNEENVACADRALYRGKAMGKNVCSF